MNSKASILIAAAAGGVVPNLVRIAIALQQNTLQIPSVGRILAYSLGLLMMAGAGAFMAWVFDEKEKKKSFYLGVGLPALLQLTFSNLEVAKTPAPPPSPMAPVSWWGPAWVPFAFADPLSPRRSSERKLQVTLEQPQRGEEVTFYSQDGRQKKSVELAASPSTIPVPEFADYCTLRYRDAVSAPASLAAPVTSVTATLQENNWNGFWQALGSSGKTSYKILLKTKEP